MRRTLALALFLAFGITAQEKTSNLPRLEGTVLDAVTGQPVRKAAVIFQRMEQGRFGASSRFVVLTDEVGHFTFAGFAAGDWTGSVERDGYVPRWQTGTDADPKPSRWRIEADTVIKDLDYRLTPTGVITGRVIDADGEPVAGASVRLAKPGAKWRGQELPNTQTNDTGEFRIYNIPPGKYIVTTAYQPPWQQPNTKLVQGPGKSVRDSSAEQYVTTHYPSTLDPRQATLVAVGAGAQVEGVQIRLLRGGVVRLRGRVVNTGDVESSMVFVNLSEIQEGAFGDGRPAGARVQADGTFEIDGIRPGRYRLRAEAVDGSERLHGSTVVELRDTDIDGIQLALSLPAKISGKVTVEGDAHLSAGVHVTLFPRGIDQEGGASTPLRADGSFTFERVYEGLYDFLLHLPSDDSDLYVKSVRFANEEVLQEGINLHGQQGDKLEVVLNDEGATLDCNVVSDKGEPLRRAQVILVPDEIKSRVFSLLRQTAIREDGGCKIRGVMPGSYRALAFIPEPFIDIRRVDDWTPYEKSAKAVRFAPKETVQLQLQTIPAQTEQQ